MTSKRDRLKQLNQKEDIIHEEIPNNTTIVDELVEQYNKAEEAEGGEKRSSPLISVIDKSRVGRPKALEGEYKPISARLKMENYEHARLEGGKYGGMNAYINYLIEQDRLNKQK